MTFTLTATGPTGTAVGGRPAVFLPTTTGLGRPTTMESFACAPVTAALQATCAGTTAGDAVQGGTVTIRFPLAAGGTADVTGVIFGAGATAAGPLPLFPLLPPSPPLFLPPPPPPLLSPPAPFLLGPPPGPAAEVPVIPEAEPLSLLVLGLAALGVGAALRRRWGACGRPGAR